MIDAGFAAELEVDEVAGDFDVVVADGGQAVGLIVAGVFFVADADEGFFQKLDDEAEDFFALRRPGRRGRCFGGAADGGEALCRRRSCGGIWFRRGWSAW